MKIASLIDIGLMKLSAIIGRGSKKDFIDIYFLLKEYISLEELLEFSKEKFKNIRGFDIQALRALVYFTDAEPEPLPETLKRIDWEKVKEYIINEVTKVTERRLGIK